MFKIRKPQKESLTDPAHMVDSVGQAARQARANVRWLLAGVAMAVIAAAAVGGFFWMRQQDDRAAADLLHATAVASIGPLTAEAAAQCGIQTAIMPAHHTIPALVDAIVEYCSRQT